MGRKKKKVIKPWCWYCNRDFEDEKVLIQHQKAKHFKCHVCYKKLYTGPGLAVHCQQVHKETIDKIPNSLPNRGSTELEIYGMEGIPEADIKKHEAEIFGKPNDEPTEKKSKVDFPVGIPPGLMPPIVPPMAGPKNPLIPTLPMSIVPGMPPIPYGPMMPGMIPPIPPIPPVPPILPGALVPPVPARAPPPPPPSAPAAGPSPVSGGVVPPPTFPAYSSAQKAPTSASALTVAPAPPPSNYASTSATSAPSASDIKPTTSSIVQAIGTKIVHPEEDLSLEERRASFPKHSMNNSSAIRHKGPGTCMAVPLGAGGLARPAFPPMSMPGYGFPPMPMSEIPLTYGYPVVRPAFPQAPRPSAPRF